jgi:TP901 family phage tail tape measure protein
MAENVVVTINVRDLGSDKVKKFSENTKSSLSDINSSVKTSNGVFSNFTKTLAGNTGAAFAVLPAYAAVGAVIGGLGAIIGTAIKDFIDFDKNLREASSIAPELARNFESARQAIIALDPALGKTSDIALGLFETLSAGISIGRSIGESIQFTADAAKLARAALTDQATAVKALSTTMSAFGADISKATAFSDIFQKTVVIGQFRFEELANSLGRVSPVAATLGISFSEMNAAVATLSQGGLSAAESVTALRAALNNIIKNADQFRAAGIDVNRILSEKDGLVKLMGKLRQVTGGNTEALTKFVPNIRGLVAALALTGPQYEALIKNNEITKNALGETDVAFQANQKSISASLERLGSSFDRAVQRMADSTAAGRVVSTIDAVGEAMNDAGDESSFFGNAMDQVGSVMLRLKSSYDLILGAGVQLEGMTIQNTAAFLEMVPGLTGVGGRIKLLGEDIENLGKGMQMTGEEARDFAKELAAGGLAAQEALNKVRKANADAMNARLERIKASNKEVGVLKVLEQANIMVAGSSDSLADSANRATNELSGLGIAGTLAASKTQQLEDQLVNVITRTDDFDDRVQGLIGGFVKQLEVTDEVAEKTRKLASEYAISIEATTKYRQQLQELGVTSDQLAGRTKILDEDIRTMAEGSGMAEAELKLLVSGFLTNTERAEMLGKKLRELGGDSAKLGGDIGQLRLQIDKAIDPTVKFAAALKVLTGTTLAGLRTDVRNTIIVVDELAKSGKVQNEVLVDSLVDLRDQYKKFGLEVPVELKKAISQQENLVKSTRTLAESMENIRGIDLDKVSAEFKLFKTDVENAARSGQLLGNELLANLDKIEDKSKKAFGTVDQITKNSISNLEQFALATVRVQDAFEAVNGITIDNLNQEVAAGIRNLEVLFQNGQIGSEQLKSRIKSLREQVELLGPSARAAFDPMLDALEKGIPLAQTLADSLNILGAKTIREVTRSAEQSKIAFLDAFKSGAVSGRELVRVYEEEVIPAFKAAGIKIPNELVQAYNRAKIKADIELSKAGLDTGEKVGNALIDGATEIVRNRFGQIVGTIKERLGRELETVKEKFDRIAPGTTKSIQSVRFAGDVEGLVQNKEDLLRLMRSFSGATSAAASSRRQISKALDIVNKRLKDLGFKTTGTMGGTELTAVPLKKVADSVSEIDRNFTQTTSSINTATDAMQEFASAASGIGTKGEFNFTGSISQPVSGKDTSLVTGTGSSRPAGSSFTRAGTSLFGRFQSGISFAQQGQLARLDQGEMIVPRDIAKRLRSLDIRQMASTSPGGAVFGALTSGASIRPGPRSFIPGMGFVGSIIIGRSRPSSSLESAGFQFVPGYGTVPTPALAAATGNTDKLGGENSQREIQKNVVTLVRGAITRRDLTRDINGATAITNKGVPQTGGS